jgi:hypothetical protein
LHLSLAQVWCKFSLLASEILKFRIPKLEDARNEASSCRSKVLGGYSGERKKGRLNLNVVGFFYVIAVARAVEGVAGVVQRAPFPCYFCASGFYASSRSFFLESLLVLWHAKQLLALLCFLHRRFREFPFLLCGYALLGNPFLVSASCSRNINGC